MQIFLSDYPTIGATLRRSRQAKRLSLRISSLDGRITITGPHFVPESTFQDFLDSKAEWILANHKHIERIIVDDGASVPVLGKPHVITTTNMRKISVVDDQILVPQHRSSIGAQVKGVLKSLARDHLAQASDHYAQRLGHSYQAWFTRYAFAVGVVLIRWVFNVFMALGDGATRSSELCRCA